MTTRDEGPTTTPESVVSAPEPAPAERAGGVPARRGSGKTARDMVLSMAVIVGIVALFVLIVPRPNAVRQPAVDLAAAAEGARTQLTFVPAEPRALPPGWVPLAAEVQRGTDDIPTWTISYQTPDDRFAAVRQAASPSARWENRQVTDGREDGTITIAGREWVVRSRPDRSITSWVDRAADLTTVVTGTASAAELSVLAESLL